MTGEGSRVPVSWGNWCCVILSSCFKLCLPLLLLLIHRHAARSERHHQQQAANDRGGLEKVVLQEVVHGLVGRDGPEGVEIDVNGQQPEDKGQRRQFGFETNGYQDDEDRPDHVLQDLRQKDRGEASFGVNGLNHK